MKNFELRRAIIDLEESLEQKEPFTFTWKVGGSDKSFYLSEEHHLDFDKRKEAIKQKAAKEMLELFKEMLVKSEQE